jgi:hypothetical protein
LSVKLLRVVKGFSFLETVVFLALSRALAIAKNQAPITRVMRWCDLDPIFRRVKKQAQTETEFSAKKG